MINFVFIFLGSFVFLGFVWAFFSRQFQAKQKELELSLKSMAFDAFEKNSRLFADLAGSSFQNYQKQASHDLELRHVAFVETMKPLQEALKKIDEVQREIEKKREGAYQSLNVQLETLFSLERDLRKETATLSQALKSSQVRGSWGEIHLKRVLELSGLLSHCDFWNQKTITLQDKILRPDVLVQLPGDKFIAIDAKTPLQAYLEASSLNSDDAAKKIQESALALRKHIKDLSSKEYWKAVDGSLEFVVLFLPIEAFYSACLQVDPLLIEFAAEQNIILATPSSLIAILRAISFSWKQDAISKNAKDIAKLGSELYDRLNVVCQHWTKLGKNLNSSVEAYNMAISSLESRALVTAKKLKDLGSISSEITDLEKLDAVAKVPLLNND